MELDDAIRAWLRVEDELIVGGRLHFGDNSPSAVAYDAIRLTGNLPFLPWGDWLQAMAELGQIVPRIFGR